MQKIDHAVHDLRSDTSIDRSWNPPAAMLCHHLIDMSPMCRDPALNRLRHFFKQDVTYVGIDVHRGARVAALAHGGQVILSARPLRSSRTSRCATSGVTG